MGRFINADAFISTGQGILGNNMFAYCLNNPVNFVDSNGQSSEALQWWSGTMWWLCGVDLAVPIGDIIYVGGIVILGIIAVATIQDAPPEIAYDIVDESCEPPSPKKNDDDDDDDDYYDDDSNFAGRQKIGKSKGSTPGNNQAQNKQFHDATKGLPKKIKRIIHDEYSGTGSGYHDIKGYADYFYTFKTR